MSWRWTLLLALAALTGAIALAQSSRPIVPDVVVDGVYSTPDTGEIRLLGVCDVRNESILCWGPDRQIDAGLRNKVVSALTGIGAGKVATVPFKFGLKNRLAIFQNPIASMASRGSSPIKRIYGPSRGYTNALDPMVAREGDSLLQILPIETDATAATAVAYADVILQRALPFEIPLKVDATGSSHGRTVTIDSIEANKPYGSRTIVSKSATVNGLIDRSPRAKTWTVRFKFGGAEASDRDTYDVRPLDKLGIPIEHVDWSGRPVVKSVPKNAPNWVDGVESGSTYAFPADSSEYDASRKTWNWRLAVDPAFVSTLRITFHSPKTVEFKDIPLDPVVESGGTK